MTVLFQDGIPDIFIPALESRGCRIQKFPTDNAAAHRVFAGCADAEVIFFRANFIFGAAEVKALPRLKLAALVSTGTDNLDARPLTERGIKLVTGEGANAQAVVDYVVQALLLGGFIPGKHSVGVVGAGRVGGKVWQFMRSVAAEAEYYDPFKAFPGSLEKVLSCDFVTFHVPLAQGGEHPTAAMLNERYFKAAKKTIRIIQACRGGIWDENFYRSLTPMGRIQILAQDVYPQEPPAAADLTRAQFSTPHIAGYSTQGRLGGILRGIRELIPDFDAGAVWPQSRAWFLDTEAAQFTAPGKFMEIRDRYFWRKEFHEYNEAEQLEFREKFPEIPAEFMDALFVLH